jgi:hypothetical protein
MLNPPWIQAKLQTSSNDDDQKTPRNAFFLLEIRSMTTSLPKWRFAYGLRNEEFEAYHVEPRFSAAAGQNRERIAREM